jgi:aspartyl-tRNA(Asn)/glutamyl-tRNA(Gln) amidotransferase subunit C
MKLTTKEVEHIAELARLGMTTTEKKKFQTQISSILDYVEKLGEVNTVGVEPTAQVSGVINALRADEVKSQTRETMENLVKSAPMRENNLVKTKAVFE